MVLIPSSVFLVDDPVRPNSTRTAGWLGAAEAKDGPLPVGHSFLGLAPLEDSIGDPISLAF
jgi:hypothetical protein